MKKQNKYKFFDGFIYSILLIIAFFLQSTPTLFKASSPSPSLILALILIISFFENPRFAALFGLIGGMLIDSISVGGSGIYALIYMLTGLICSLITKALLQNNFASFAVIGVPVILIHQVLDIIIKSGFTNGLFGLFFNFYLTVAIYTFAVAFLLYLLFSFVIKKDEKFKMPTGIIKNKK